MKKDAFTELPIEQAYATTMRLVWDLGDSLSVAADRFPTKVHDSSIYKLIKVAADRLVSMTTLPVPHQLAGCVVRVRNPTRLVLTNRDRHLYYAGRLVDIVVSAKSELKHYGDETPEYEIVSEYIQELHAQAEEVGLFDYI